MALRHLLSFTYDRQSDSYQKISVWSNPFDRDDCLLMPTLAGRCLRERDRASLFARCGVTSSEDGIVSGVLDFEAAAAAYVAHYWDAIDPDVKAGVEPLLLVLTGDATGGWRGEAVTHGELGIGSWSRGKGQSKLTLLPLFLMEGDDSADNLRNRIATS